MAARRHAPTDPALALKPGGAVAEGAQGEDSSGQPRAEALAPHPWQVAYRHVAKKRDEHTYAAAASGPAEKQALLFREPSERSSPFQSTCAEAG